MEYVIQGFFISMGIFLALKYIEKEDRKFERLFKIIEMERKKRNRPFKYKGSQRDWEEEVERTTKI